MGYTAYACPTVSDAPGEFNHLAVTYMLIALGLVFALLF